MQKLWHDLAWEQFLSWQESGDVRTFRRVCRLIRDIDRNIDNNELVIRSCRGHYE